MQQLNQVSKFGTPSHSQWGVLNSLKRQQYEQALRIQKLIDHQKKNQFKSQLDKQLEIKSHSNKADKDADKSYKEFIINKTTNEQIRQKEHKIQKYSIRRSIQIQNQRQIHQQNLLNQSRLSQDSTNNSRYLIGFREQKTPNYIEHKKEQMMNFLNDQVKQKDQIKKNEKIKQINDYYRDLDYQNNMAKSQEMVTRNKKLKQKDQIYNYYSNLYQQKQQQTKKLEQVFVNRPIKNKLEHQKFIDLEKVQRQTQKKQEMRDVLDEQVKLHKIQTLKQKLQNSQKIDYSFFGDMFDTVSKNYGQYDKKQYSDFLKKQMESQRLNKKKLQYMDEREYLLNLNQINKALHGTYLNRSYEDSSIANVGENIKVNAKKASSLLNNQRQSQIDKSLNPQERQKMVKLEKGDDMILRSNVQQLLRRNFTPKNKIESSLSNRTRQQVFY